jgi:DASS family divalent anion:Na+ symporter
MLMEIKMKKEINLPLLVVLLIISGLLWQLPAPHGLDNKAWHLFIVFIMSIFGIITSVMPMGAVTIMAITSLVLTKTMPLKDALSGFSSPIAWLVISAFFIARGFIKTNLGKRIAYFLISKFGRTNIGLSYSMIFTEFMLSPMIPSTSARGGGIIYPIAKSLGEEYDKDAGTKSSTSAFLIATCFHTNVITCALFLTAMAGNPLIASLAAPFGINITWASWAIGAIVPGVINLCLLPFVTSKFIKPEKADNSSLVESAKKSLQEMGALSKNEIIMICNFVLMLSLWIFGAKIGIDATTAALLGFLILVITSVINWNDVTTEKAAWETMIWFAILLMLSEYLTKFGVDRWIEHNIRLLIGDYTGWIVITFLMLSYFYSHYLFASVTAHITVMFSTFLLLMIDSGMPLKIVGISLAILSNLSAGLTNYGINSAPIYFSAGYFTTGQWLKLGIIVSTFNLILWIIVGGAWWKVLGWW